MWRVAIDRLSSIVCRCYWKGFEIMRLFSLVCFLARTLLVCVRARV